MFFFINIFFNFWRFLYINIVQTIKCKCRFDYNVFVTNDTCDELNSYVWKMTNILGILNLLFQDKITTIC